MADNSSSDRPRRPTVAAPEDLGGAPRSSGNGAGNSDGRAGSAAPADAKIDRTDRAILAALAEDGRLSVAEVARRANVSRANAYIRIERLTAAGVITGYGARIDSRLLGLDVSALVFLRVDQVEWRRLRESLLEVEAVEMVGLTSGDFDFVVLVRAASTVMLRDVVLARFLAMEGVRGTQTLLLFDDVVRRPCVPAS